MKIKLLIIWFGMAALLLSSHTLKEPIKILCIGDSITQGGKTTQKEYTYRLPLQMLLHEKGISYDFIGSRQKGLHEDAVWPDVAKGVPFDPDHEGYYGQKTAVVCGKVMENLKNYNSMPDIVLVHLGTNDQKSTDFVKDVGEPLRDLISSLREKNPVVKIFLGHLNFNDSKAAKEIRSVVENVKKDMSTKKSPVVTVHHYIGWHENPEDVYTDTFDWAHPNLKGQEKMAKNWFEAMEKAEGGR